MNGYSTFPAKAFSGRFTGPQTVFAGGTAVSAGHPLPPNRRNFVKARRATNRSAGAWQAVARSLFVARETRRITFTPGEVQVEGNLFGLVNKRVLQFSPGSVEVTGFIGLYTQWSSFQTGIVEVSSPGLGFARVMSFTPGDVEVSSPGFGQWEKFLWFSSGDVEVSAPGIKLARLSLLQFTPTEVRVESFGFNLEFVESGGRGGNINVEGSSFRMVPIKFLSFTSSPDITVSGSNFRLQPRWRLTFRPVAEIPVTSPGFVIREGRTKLRFNPGEIHVLGNSFGLIPLIPKTIPGIRPTGREFKPPKFAVYKGFTESGIQFQRMRASRAGGAKLKLIYEHLTSSEVQFFMDLWDQALGSTYPVQLTEEVLSSVQASLQAHMASPEIENEWFIETVPTVTSVQTDVFNLSLELSSRYRPQVNRMNPSNLEVCSPASQDESGSITCDTVTVPDCAFANQTGC